jgi:hypothetical protein
MQTRNKFLREWLKQKIPPVLVELSQQVNKSNPKFAILESNQFSTTILCHLGHKTIYPNWMILGGKPPGRGYRKTRQPKKLICHTCICGNRVYNYILDILNSMLGIPFELEYANPNRIKMSIVRKCYNSGLNISIVVKCKKNPLIPPIPDDVILIENNYSGDHASLCEYLHALADELKRKLLELINRDPNRFHPWIRDSVNKYNYKYTFKCTQGGKNKPILGNFEELVAKYVYGDESDSSDDERLSIKPRF